MYSDLTLKTLDNEPGLFEVVADVYWHNELLPGGVYVVPRGFKTDLASIPVGLRSLFSRTGRSRKPAVFHDHMYSKKWETRKICDDLFYIGLRERGVSKWAAWLYWAGVRAGGWTRGNW